LRTWSATQRFQAEKGFDPVIPLEAKLSEIWKPEHSRQTVSWPIGIRAGHF
jgi:hypothetical protein